MHSPVEQIKARLSIEEVVSSYIKLEKAGSNLKAKCPFHSEKTPSFFVSRDRGTYYCFGCGASGDIFSFVEEFEGLDFKGALKMLAERAGVRLQGYSKERIDEKDRLYQAMESAAEYFAGNLSKENIEYLKSRGLEEKTIKNFRIGFAKDEWRGLYENLKINFRDVELERAGLIKKTEGKLYDRFRNRIMFPISDTSGRVIAFSGRIVGEAEPKYLNSPETPIFSKSAVLYGLDKAKSSIRSNNFSILVEGQMDLILSHQALYRNTVATSGTALSDREPSKENAVTNLGLVRRLSNNIILSFDGDKAGLNATKRAGKIALSLGMDVKVAALPEGMDPADLICHSGVPAWKEAIRNSKHIIEFLLEKVLQNSGGDSRKTGRLVKEEILPYVAALQSAIEKNHFLKKISDATGISFAALEEDFKTLEKEEKSENYKIEEAVENTNTMRRRDYIERKLLGIIFWQKSLGNNIEADKTLSELSEITGKDSKEILESAQGGKEDLIFEAEVFYGNASAEKDAAELLQNLRREYLKEELGRKMRELHISEEAKDREKSGQLMADLAEINKKIQNINNGRIGT